LRNEHLRVLALGELDERQGHAQRSPVHLHALAGVQPAVTQDEQGGFLAGHSLGRLEYALFVPRSLVPQARGASSRPRRTGKAATGEASQGTDDPCMRLLSDVPLVSLSGEGDFSRRLSELVRRAKSVARIRLECDSFPSACRAVALGICGAVLPAICSSELPMDRTAVFKTPLLKDLDRPICLSWNPRLVRLRPLAGKVRDLLQRRLAF
jgi:DNA-binding transcriptional LysR family regulator